MNWFVSLPNITLILLLKAWLEELVFLTCRDIPYTATAWCWLFCPSCCFRWLLLLLMLYLRAEGSCGFAQLSPAHRSEQAFAQFLLSYFQTLDMNYVSHLNTSKYLPFGITVRDVY